MTSDRMAVVTGTSSGIGAAVATDLVARGWEVVGIARRAAAIASPGYRHLALDLQDVPTAVIAIERELGAWLQGRAWQRVALVNNAASALLGPVQKLDAAQMLRSYAVNAVIPIWLMGFVVERCRPGTRLRIVNLSSGAAVRPFPGLAAYCSSKAALRMAGMVFAAELESDVSILSYEPGVVDTEMQLAARSKSVAEFPWVGTFQDFAAGGALVAPQIPAGEIVEFLESDGSARFVERRRGG